MPRCSTDKLTTAAAGFAPWVKHLPGPEHPRWPGATIVFPHAGAAAASYRGLAAQLSTGGETFIVQYPQRADRFGEPAAATISELARSLFAAGRWDEVAPLRLFGHSMGAVVAFEFARIAEEHEVAIQKLWVSAGPAPCTVARMPRLPTADAELLAHMAEIGGTDPRLLADEEFAQLITTAVRGDYRALNRYDCAPGVAIRAPIHAIGGRSDRRIDVGVLRRWAKHTTAGFAMSFYNGGHFYVYDHIDAVAAQVNANVR